MKNSFPTLNQCKAFFRGYAFRYFQACGSDYKNQLAVFMECVEIADRTTAGGKCVNCIGKRGGIRFNLYGKNLNQVYQMALG